MCLLALLTSTLWAQDGAAIYKERCASCHDTPAPRVPSLSTIKAMSGEAIYLALTRGVMKTQAEGLSSAQIFAPARLYCAHRRRPRGRPPSDAHVRNSTGVFGQRKHA